MTITQSQNGIIEPSNAKASTRDPFFVGFATSVYQSSGGLNSNWSDWETKKHLFGIPTIEDNVKCGDSCDFWNLYEEVRRMPWRIRRVVGGLCRRADLLKSFSHQPKVELNRWWEDLIVLNKSQPSTPLPAVLRTDDTVNRAGKMLATALNATRGV